MTISIKACDDAHLCMLCARACPLGLIQICPVEAGGYERVNRSRVAGHFRQLCDGCGACAAACPKGLIAVSLESRPDWVRAAAVMEGDPGLARFIEERQAG